MVGFTFVSSPQPYQKPDCLAVDNQISGIVQFFPVKAVVALDQKPAQTAQLKLQSGADNAAGNRRLIAIGIDFKADNFFGADLKIKPRPHQAIEIQPTYGNSQLGQGDKRNIGKPGIYGRVGVGQIKIIKLLTFLQVTDFSSERKSAD